MILELHHADRGLKRGAGGDAVEGARGLAIYTLRMGNRRNIRYQLAI
jgi:hypothetical protein